jgi:hypothetical protein
MVMDQDTEHLRLLSLFHYIRGGIGAFVSCIFIIYIFMGLILTASARLFHTNNGPPAAVGLIFVVIGSAAVILGWTWAALTIYAGRCLAQRKHRIFCMVIAGINCLFLPYGTILGIFTLVVLQRPSVQAIFDRAAIAA